MQHTWKSEHTGIYLVIIINTPTRGARDLDPIPQSETTDHEASPRDAAPTTFPTSCPETAERQALVRSCARNGLVGRRAASNSKQPHKRWSQDGEQ